MATNTAGDLAREYHTAQTHYLRRTITKADDNTTPSLGFLPAGAVVVRAGVIVYEAFNGGEHTLDMGTAADPDGFATDIALGTIGNIAADEMATTNDQGPYASATEIVCVVKADSATAGKAVAYVEYFADLG